MTINPKAIIKADSRLRIARKALTELSRLKDLSEGDTKEIYRDNWFIFITGIKNIWTVLEQGSKTTPQNRQWFGNKKYERKNDELLQYFFISRNDASHGLEEVLYVEPASLSIGVSKPGYSSSMRLDGHLGDHGTLKITPLDNKPVLIEHNQSKMKLAIVKGRNPNDTYPPPKFHLGKKIEDQDPINVGKIVISYFESLIEEAKSLA